MSHLPEHLFPFFGGLIGLGRFHFERSFFLLVCVHRHPPAGPAEQQQDHGGQGTRTPPLCLQWNHSAPRPSEPHTYSPARCSPCLVPKTQRCPLGISHPCHHCRDLANKDLRDLGKHPGSKRNLKRLSGRWCYRCCDYRTISEPCTDWSGKWSELGLLVTVNCSGGA